MKKMEEEKLLTITRKFVIRPFESDTNEWKKRVISFTESYAKEQEERLKEKKKYFQKRKREEVDDFKKENWNRKIQKVKDEIENTKTYAAMVNEDEFPQAIVNAYTFHLVKSSMESEARRKNYILSWAFSEMIQHGVPYMDAYGEKAKFINEMIKPAYRKEGSSKGSLFDNVEIDNILKSYGTAFNQELTGKLKSLVKDGLLEGSVTLPTYKLDSPFTVAKGHISISHDYDSFEELCEHINEPGCKLYFNYGGNQKPSIARFLIDTGSARNKEELNSTLLRLVSGEYELCGSSIQFSKDGKKIILNASMNIPKKEMELDENVVVGVDLGIKTPAVCALNNSNYIRKSIGDVSEFLKIRTQLQAQKARLQKQLKATGGGHGRKKKLRAMDRFHEKERNFVKTYNHFVSKAVVDFALKNHAKYINMENLSGFDGQDVILRNWSYFELQSFIEYKASKYGIEVRYIDPYHTSQVCSKCGHWEEGQRIDQAHFVCKKCGNKMNADFNAAKNIAMSVSFKSKKKIF